MQRLVILLAALALLSGCTIASENYLPIKGVRDAPGADVYVGRSGWGPGPYEAPSVRP